MNGLPAMSGREVATRELDAEVATKVFGCDPKPDTDCGFPEEWFCVCEKCDPDKTGMGTWVPPFSTDIAAAMQVVEAMRGRGVSVFVTPVVVPDMKAAYIVSANEWCSTAFERLTPDFDADTLADLPAAICRCALAALSALEGRDGNQDARKEPT